MSFKMILPYLKINPSKDLLMRIFFYLLLNDFLFTLHFNCFFLCLRILDNKVLSFIIAGTFLQAKQSIYFELSPGKIDALISFVGKSPPKSASHNSFDQIRVITFSYIKFIASIRYILRCADIESITIINFPQKISIHLYSI